MANEQPDRSNSQPDTQEMDRDAFQKYALSTLAKTLSNTVDRITSDTSEPFVLGEGERQRLETIRGVGIYQGLAVTVGTFLMLRGARYVVVRRLQEMSKPGPKMSSPFSATNHTSSSPRLPPRNPAWDLLHFFLDLGASGMTGLTATILLTDQPKIASTLASVPLSHGHSRLSDAFCPPMVAQVAQLRHNAMKSEQAGVLHISKDDISSPETAPSRMYLTALLQFEHNCRLRMAQEDMIRRNNGMGAELPVFIPHPGVVSGVLGQMNVDEESPSDDFSQHEFYEPNVDQEQGDWANSFTEDQENDRFEK